MYQLPVANVEKIRKARRAVKKVLCDIGLEDCQDFLKDLNENSEKNSEEEEIFEDTEWIDFTDGFNGRTQKKWPYRSPSLCCSMCKYSSQNIYNFRSHVSRCHSFVQSLCALALCTQCPFTAPPKDLRKHTMFFHAQTQINPQPTKESAVAGNHRSNEKYQCRKCGFPTSLIFALKKHIILKHLGSVAEQYIGYRIQNHGGASVKVYCCKVCRGNTGTLDQMLHHMLVAPTHYSVSTQVQTYIYENKNFTLKPTVNGNGVFVTFPSIAPKAQQPQLLNTNSLVLPSNGQPPRTVLTLQGTPNSTTLICAPGSNQAFLPPQASALVQLASAEAKGLLQPGATITLQGALPQGQSIQIPTVSNVTFKPAPLQLTSAPSQPQPIQHSQSVLFTSGLQPNGAPPVSTVAKPAVSTQNAATNLPTLQGTMLTSQSLLSHLIPTGNKVNGMPTYTFAPLQVTMPGSQSTVTPLKPIEQTNNSTQVKKWITCPHCNELFPSNIFDMHTEVVHQTKSTIMKTENVVARVPFLKKMPDKTVKCLTCKILLSEKSVFQHLLHGLNCLSCSAVFFSIKQLIEHIKQHNPASKAYSDFLRQNFRVYTKGPGVIVFPYFDVHTTGPKEVLGDNEVNLGLITSSNEHIYFKLKPSIQPDTCSAPVKLNSTYCPFCDEKSLNETKHLQHLKQKHFVAPTIHAILRTEAFKCIYCNGVYTGKVTQQAVMLHIQRCRCSPKQPQPSKTAATEDLTIARAPQASLKPVQQITTKPPGLYFLQVPQGITIKPAVAPPTAPVIKPTLAAPAAPAERPETEEEAKCKKRLEAALKEVIEANKREREERAAKRQKLEQRKLSPPPKPQIDSTVKLVLEPTPMERRCDEERRMFATRYFNRNPYASKAETEELCRRLSFSKPELVAIFSKRRSKCMKTMKNTTAAVLLGFNMTELTKLKHNLLIPEQQPPETTEHTPDDGPEPMDEGGNDEQV